MIMDVANDRGLSGESAVERGPLVNPYIGAITEALLEMGGAAHRDLVITWVAERLERPQVTERLRRDLIDAFIGHCDYAAAAGVKGLFYRPPGEDFRRWALTTESLAFLRGGDRRRSAAV